MTFKYISKVKKSLPTVILFSKYKASEYNFSKSETIFIKEQLKEQNFAVVEQAGIKTCLIQEKDNQDLEHYRTIGAKVVELLPKQKKLQLVHEGNNTNLLALLEGVLLANYKFDKYYTKESSKGNWLEEITLVNVTGIKDDIQEITTLCEASLFARDLVNEPVNKLTTTKFASIAQNLAWLNVDVFNKRKIESLKMGGVLAVNQGSNEEPAFIVAEWKPEEVVNNKPVVLVGKGILFDTGGANIKTENFMTDMKADMGGAAAVLGSLKAISENKLPVHVIGLIPVTENRINGSETVPGDVIQMHNGLTVEVLNTDAEGRLVLADALSYAEKFKPQLVIDLATLTGSAFRTLGHNGAVFMGNAKNKDKRLLETAAGITHERIWEMPMWKEFEDTLKSKIADLNNLGEGPGQMICAGYFLKNFTNYPWLHIDIAGPAFLPRNNKYLSQGGSGFGVRLLYQFIKDKFELN